MIKIYDDLLSPKEYKEIKNTFLNDKFPLPWNWSDVLAGDSLDVDDLDNFQLTHVCYNHSILNLTESRGYIAVNPIINHPDLNIRALVRIKANLNFRTPKIVKHGFHVDVPFDCMTGVYYVNSNDGYTEFKDGTKVESVANRMVTFPSQTLHSGTSCTNKSRRIGINFVYFAAERIPEAELGQYGSNK